jgi:hypothetical protein
VLAFATNLRWLILAFHKIFSQPQRGVRWRRTHRPEKRATLSVKPGVSSVAARNKHQIPNLKSQWRTGETFCRNSGSLFPVPMKYLTKEQQKVLCVILFLLLVGLAVKTWRTAHPPKQAGTVQK